MASQVATLETAPPDITLEIVSPKLYTPQPISENASHKSSFFSHSTCITFFSMSNLQYDICFNFRFVFQVVIVKQQILQKVKQNCHRLTNGKC